MNDVLTIMRQASEEAHYLHNVAGFWEVRDTGVGVLLALQFLKTVPKEEILNSYPTLELDDLNWLEKYYSRNQVKIDTLLEEWLNEDDTSDLPFYA